MATAQMGAVLKHIRNLVADHQRNEQSDQDLLHALVTRNDQRAFETVLRRYGPMVLRVCRRVLGHEQDAEDAFQATFLVLARQSASIRKRKSLASFLHGVAYSMANNARRAAARRRKHERQAIPVQPTDPALTVAWQEIQVLLDEEVERLPENLRGPFILCCLENRKASEVARLLALEEATIWKRLSRARKLLRERLARRGLSLMAALTAAAAATTRADATLSSRLISMTVKAATAAPALATGLVSPNVAALMKGASVTLFVHKFKIATIMLLATGLVATSLGALVRQALAARQELGAPAHDRVETSMPRENVKPTVAKEDNAKDAVVFSGRVLDPDGKRVADATLHLIVQSWRKKPLQVQTTSGSDGAFRLPVPVAESQAYTDDSPWKRTWIVAMAKGFGPAVSARGELASSSDLTLQLAKDDVPIQGRILDLEGKPIAGVTVRVDELSVPITGDLTPWLQALEANTQDSDPIESRFLERVLFHPQKHRAQPLFPSVVTDAKGCFQLNGVGRERVVRLTLEGPTIARSQVSVRTRPGKPIHTLMFANKPREGRLTYYGATFDHLAAPTRPIVGLVRDKDTGKPIAGIPIVSERFARMKAGGDSSVGTVTDKDGRYRLLGMPKGSGNAIKAAPAPGQPYLQSEREIEDTPGLEPITVDFDLQRGVLVKGRVLDQATGMPVFGNVQYLVFADNVRYKDVAGFTVEHYLETSPDGSFQLVALPGRGLLMARAWNDHYRAGVGSDKMQPWDGTHNFLLTVPFLGDPGGFHTVVEINPPENAESLSQDLFLDPGTMPHGRVVGPDGVPVASAHALGLTAYGTSRNWTRTPLPGADFTVWGLDAHEEREVVFVQEDKHWAGAVKVRGDTREPLIVKLEPWGVVSGRLVGPNGMPQPGVLLRIAAMMLPRRSFQTDKDGRFRIEGLAPGVEYTMEVMMNDQVAGRVFTNLTVNGGETKDLGDIQVKPKK